MGKYEIDGLRSVSRSDDQAMPNSSVELNARSCTLRDVARLARVSTAIVSRVLNSSETVSGKMRGRVMLAIAGLQYCPGPPRLRTRASESSDPEEEVPDY
jgi:Bacterial regulatory proteins, lacI family